MPANARKPAGGASHVSAHMKAMTDRTRQLGSRGHAPRPFGVNDLSFSLSSRLAGVLSIEDAGENLRRAA